MGRSSGKPATTIDHPPDPPEEDWRILRRDVCLNP
jgi:hypothetical protein